MRDPEAYSEQKRELLLGIEGQILEAVNPVMERAIVASEALSGDATEAEQEAVLVELNDELRTTISTYLFLNQRRIADLAFSFHTGSLPRMLSAEELMETLEIDGDTFTDIFKRKSPSRFMAQLLGGARKAIEAAVNTVVASATWSLGALQEASTWDRVLEWEWRSERDSKVCPLCVVLDGERFKTREDAPPYPRHWACRCDLIPAVG